MRKAVALALALLIPSAPAPAPSAAVPGTGCEVFPSDNAWNADISRLPIHRKSRVWLRSMHSKRALLHPDFGAPPYGLPFTVVDDSTPTVTLMFDYADESDDVPYPLTASTPIEAGSDRHALMIDRDTCVLYELYATDWNGGSPRAGSGAVFDLSSNSLRPAGWTSADAAGLPIFPGLVRYDEVRAGSIDHAIRFTAECTRNRYVWPARHQAGEADKRCPPMGARFRLKDGYDVSGFSPDAQVVLQAMKTHGLVLADNGADWYFQGTENPGWTDELLDELKTVPARAFRAVRMGGCKISNDSAAYAAGPRCPMPP